MKNFEVSIDLIGNVYMNRGYVIDMTTATPTVHEVGSRGIVTVQTNQNYELRTTTNSAMQFGGSNGQNLDVSGTISNAAPLGKYQRVEAQLWVNERFAISGDPTAGAELSDGTDVVAEITGAYTTYPEGTWASTAYGETTYNGGTAFTLTIDREAFPDKSQAFSSAVVQSTFVDTGYTALLTRGLVTTVYGTYDGFVIYPFAVWPGMPLAYIVWNPSVTAWQCIDAVSGAITAKDPVATLGLDDPFGTYHVPDAWPGGSDVIIARNQVNGYANIETDVGIVASGEYYQDGWGIWRSGADSIVVNSDGTAAINDGTDDVAIRPAGSNQIPNGQYDSTPYGEALYGQAFKVQCSYTPPFPNEVWVWIELELASGSITTVNGPFTADSLPASTASTKIIPIYHSNGDAQAQQIVDGQILWT